MYTIEVHYCVKSNIGDGYAAGSQRFHNPNTFFTWLQEQSKEGAVLITKVKDLLNDK